MMDSDYNERASAFNLTQWWLLEINKCLTNAHNNYANHKPKECYYWLKTAKLKFVSNLTTQERAKLRILERKAADKIQAYQSARLKSEGFKSLLEKQKIMGRLHNEALDVCEDYNEALLDLMEKYQLLLRKKEDKTRIN